MNIRKIIREEIDSDWGFMDRVSDVDFLNSGRITDDELIEVMKTIGTEDIGMLVTDTRNGEDFIVEWDSPMIWDNSDMDGLSIRTFQIKNYEETGGKVELEKHRTPIEKTKHWTKYVTDRLYRVPFFREKLNLGSWKVLNIIPKSDYK
jgi:hypothetical protein